MKVIVCASGALGLTGLKAISMMKGIDIVAVLTDQRSFSIERFAIDHRLPVFIGNPRKGAFASRIPEADVLCSVNYLFVLPTAVFKKASRLAFNIHGSLLPRYMGRTPNTWAIIHDEIETGITVHEIVKDCDAGDILYQERIPISNTDTGGALLERMNLRYPFILRKVFGRLKRGALIKKPQDLEKRSYFGKRQPQDGLIDWQWSARRVYNWVRAQTRPYPGAFSLRQGDHWYIWQVEEVYGLKVMESRHPGDIVEVRGKTYVRCGQGAVRIVDAQMRKGAL